jgi:hypothetical protein
MLAMVVGVAVLKKLFGPIQLKPTAPGAVAEMLAVAYWQMFAGILTTTGDVGTTDKFETAWRVQVSTPFVK